MFENITSCGLTKGHSFSMLNVTECCSLCFQAKNLQTPPLPGGTQELLGQNSWETSRVPPKDHHRVEGLTCEEGGLGAMVDLCWRLII